MFRDKDIPQYVDFAAVVAVYKQAVDDKDANKEDYFGKELFIPIKAGDVKNFNSLDTTKSNDNVVKELTLNNFIMPLVMEISYPADFPYEKREKSYFRFEIFNEKYELMD